MGCYATRAPEEVAALPNVVEVVTDKRELPDLLGRFGVIDVPTGICGFGRRHRAYVKVQDGCMLRCSFCIIPYVRPQLTSRPMEHIVDEVRRLVDQRLSRNRPHGHSPRALRRRVESRARRRAIGCGCHIWLRASPTAGRISRAAFEHRSDRSDARADRRDGDYPRQGLPAFAHLDAKRQRQRAAADAAAVGSAAICRSLPAAARAARSAGDHDRHHRRLPRRDGRGVRRRRLRRSRASASRRFTSSRSAPGAARRRRRCRGRCRSIVQQERRRELASVEEVLRTATTKSLIGRRCVCWWSRRSEERAARSGRLVGNVMSVCDG